MKCQKAQQFLTEYFYAQPDEEHLNLLQNHFQSCSDCRGARDRFEATLKVIERREKLQVDEAFWQDFQTGLEQRLARETLISAPGRRSLWPVRKYRSLRERASLGSFQPLLRPVLVKSVSVAAIFLITIWAGLHLLRGLSGNHLSMDDWVLLSELVELEEDLDIMQEVLDDEEVDLLLQMETYLEKRT